MSVFCVPSSQPTPVKGTLGSQETLTSHQHESRAIHNSPGSVMVDGGTGALLDSIGDTEEVLRLWHRQGLLQQKCQKGRAGPGPGFECWEVEK